MEHPDSDAQEKPTEPEENHDESGRFEWAPLEYDAALQAEGLFGLEVLQDESGLPPIKKAKTVKEKAKKKKTPVKKQAKEEEEADTSEELPDGEIEKATRAWNSLLFDDWEIPIQVRRNLHAAGMLLPTTIQKLVFKPSLTGSANIVASAKTGSGKTLAFSLPIILALLKHERAGEERPILCLAVLPTRELALQVKDTIAMLLKGTSMSVFALIGGIAIQKQERVLKYKPEVIVATPGRLWDAMQELDMKFDLKYLVLDEADRLVSDKAFKELGSIVAKVRTSRTQNFICSATMLNKKKDLKVIFKMLQIKNPTVCVASHKGDVVMPYDQFAQQKFFKIKEDEETCNTTLPENLKFQVVKCLDNEKELKLVAYLMEHYSNVDHGRTIIFVNSISYAYRLEPLLSLILWRDKHELRIAKSHCMTLDKESKVNYITSLHSRLRQKQRLKRLEQFNKHDKAIMVCTDVAARGIDLPKVDGVVHFQPPRNASLFIHRSGRTARLSAQGTRSSSALMSVPGAAICICESSEAETWEKLFKAVNRRMDDEEEILGCIPQKQYQRWSPAEVPSNVAGYKKLLMLASSIEAQEHQVGGGNGIRNNVLQLTKKAKTESWLHTFAKQADIVLSDEESDEEARHSRSTTYKLLKAGKRKLLSVSPKRIESPKETQLRSNNDG
ncbi:DEAD/DEAH box helicase, putative [Babesia bigemina]|uniref:DEAD/DEAH box helicase, putative n=1 Tax=Babesia bigemina TaxID=5866 RepID=A0A061DAS7_BABBI|nr:DEAD/DEAH box helicase, putative [Babesia bigemina]CDR97786.1 DEAD/DEAH box helicase, putative [Babesia bigemina]|eukprot:XP_012769972.1 DEAD/DEAH box helicase, putative [Babesia bigemina]